MDIEEQDNLGPRLEMTLREELRKQLDPQVGRAVPYFLQRCAGEQYGRRVGRRRRGRLLVGLIAVAATFCAALIAWERIRPAERPNMPHPEAVVAVPAAATGQQPLVTRNADGLQPNVADGVHRERDGKRAIEQTRSLPTADGRPASVAEPLIVDRILKTSTRDEGTLLVGHTTVRKVRRQWLERVEWFDPQNGARVQRIVPREKILYIPLAIN